MCINAPTSMAELPEGEERPEGRYANCFQIGFNAYEFVIDFAQEYPPGSPRFHTRIVTSPELAGNLSETLNNSLRDHERKYKQPDENEGAS